MKAPILEKEIVDERDDINSIYTQGLDTVVEDSMGLLALFHEAEDN